MGRYGAGEWDGSAVRPYLSEVEKAEIEERLRLVPGSLCLVLCRVKRLRLTRLGRLRRVLGRVKGFGLRDWGGA